MLDREQITYIDSNFGVYDHEWRFYSSFLGEPFLLLDNLVYFDSRILYICAFPLSNPCQEINAEKIERIVTLFSDKKTLEAVNIWGRISDAPSSIRIDKNKVKPIDLLDEYDSDDCESIIPIDQFNYQKFKRAKSSRNSSLNKGNYTYINSPSLLTHQHIRLIEYFLSIHSDLSLVHTSFCLATQSMVGLDNVYFVDCYLEDKLIGFGILSLSMSKSANLIWGFYDNSNASRAADSVMVKVIEFCKEKGVKKLHLGYSATPSLLAFKRKWGATLRGPTYREIFYSSSETIVENIKTGSFLWRDRLFASKLRELS